MGLFDKHNPRATPESARLWAIGGGVVGGILGFIGWLRMYLKEDMPFVAVFFFVPWMTFFCGLAGWAMEWQMPSDEGLPPQNRPPKQTDHPKDEKTNLVGENYFKEQCCDEVEQRVLKNKLSGR